MKPGLDAPGRDAPGLDAPGRDAPGREAPGRRRTLGANARLAAASASWPRSRPVTARDPAG